MPTGLVLPYRASSVRPATIVGSANGRSIKPFTSALPRNSSRTSTHAISTPITASIAATTTLTPSVSRMAAIAWRFVTASQNSPAPPSKERTTTAASGISTISVSQATLSPPTTSGPVRTRRPAGRAGRSARTGGAPAIAVSLCGGDTELLLDLGHGARVRVEEVGVDLVPAAELVDLEERLRVRVRALVHQLGRDRAVALGGVDLLGLLRLEEVQEGLGLLGRLGLLGDRGRVLDEDRLVRDHVVELHAGLLRGDRLVLVGDQHVALAAAEGRERLAGRLVLHGGVAQDALEEVERLFGRLALLDLGPVGGHEVPLGPAGGERVGRDDLDAVLGEVVPGLDVLGVAVADGEHHDGVGDEALRVVVGPVGVDDPRLDELVDVGREGQRDDVGRQPGLDRAGLVAGSAVGLRELHALALGSLVEGRDQLAVRLLGRRVGDQRDLAAAPVAAGGLALLGGPAAAAQHREPEGREHQAEQQFQSLL